MSHGLSRPKRALFELLPLSLAALVVLVAVFSVWQTADVKAAFLQKTALATSAPLPALRIVQLVSTLCSECWSPNALATALAGRSNSTVQTVAAQTPEGQELVRKYGIARAPTLIVTGQVDDSRLAASFSQGWRTQADARIFVGQEPVYFNPLTYEVTGKVSWVQVVDPGCDQCADLSALAESLKKAGVYLSAETVVNSTSLQGADLVRKYRPASLPFLVLSKDASAYPDIVEAWKGVGTVEPDGAFVWRQAVAPFRNTTTDRVVGLVSLVELENRSCTACYDVSIHERLLANLGLVVSNVTRLDVASVQGKALAGQYNLTQVPTVLISSDAAFYPSFMQVWPQVGTREADGRFVFRNLAALPNATVANVSAGSAGGVPA
ncbi:hypothetical protein HYV43_00650 [Candidatus Micrarchaeota archaeon]|nr:hypothetical protein [Candidatus Micrarchaeota archaeon]